ncbi:MAG: RluA family pseudouridine synthase [Clostridia bacterium]|nr:RluA family pseudouridine synthase [Clostridia bacterium]
MDEIIITVSDEFSSQRIDKALSSLTDFTRSHIQRILENGEVTVNGKTASKGLRLTAGDEIRFTPPEPVEIEAKPENIPLDVVYEDSDLLVVNKPRGMVVHPAAGNYDGTLVNALLYHCGDSLSGINGVIRPGIVHRIDKDTSGLLIVAKNDFAHERLAEQIKEHSFKRQYRAVVHGGFKEPQGTVNAPIGRSPKDRKKMCVTERNSRSAVSHYEVLDSNGKFSYIRVTLETGRTHQIRVHMSHIGHPVAGDPVYGPKNGVTSLGGQCLHAGLIGFVHPRDGRYIELEADLPDYFTKFLKSQSLGNE